MSEFRTELDGAIGKKLGGLAMFGLGAIILYIALALVFSFWPFSVVAGVVSKVTSPNAIITNYEWFYDEYHQIGAYDSNISVAERAWEKASEASKDQRFLEYTGLIMVRNSQAQEYNARSKEITRNLWKAHDIPYQIAPYEPKEGSK